MARFSTTVSSPHPPAVVHEVLADFSSVAEWDPNVLSAERDGEGPLAVGTRFVVLNDFFGQKQKLRYELTEKEAPDRFVVVARTSRFDSIDTVTTTADTGGGSSVTYDAHIVMKGVGRFFDPLVGLLFRIVGSKAAKGLEEFVQRPDLAERAA